MTTNNFTAVALDDDGDEVMTVDLVCMTCLRPVCGMREWTLAEVVAEAETHVCSADAKLIREFGRFLDELVDGFAGAVEVDPASPPQSTETPDESTPDDPSTPDAVEAATAWLLRDHDERVETGTVRPARERAAELVDAVRPIIAAEALRDAAEYIEALPPGGEALSGEYWYRSGLTDAAHILRDRADETGVGRG